MMKLDVRTDSRASIWIALLGTRRENGYLRIFIMFYLFSIFYDILCRTSEFLYIEYRITKLVELTVVYPFVLLPAFLMYLFMYLFWRIMLKWYNLISSELSVKVDSIKNVEE